MDTVETTLTAAGESYGRGEEAFSKAQDNSANPQNGRAVLIENISKPEIVDGNSFADLIMPKREVYIQHKLFSFLALDEGNVDHKKVLSDMLDLAFQKNGESNNTLYFNVRRKKNSADDPDYYAIMSVAYMHLWSVQTDAMRRSDDEFKQDGRLGSDIKITAEIARKITESASLALLDFDSDYAPVDVKLFSGSITDLFLATRKVLRVFEQDLPKTLDKGVRLMARKQNDGWQVHILTGARLQPISKKD